jgi:hypothetical protein
LQDSRCENAFIRSAAARIKRAQPQGFASRERAGRRAMETVQIVKERLRPEFLDGIQMNISDRAAVFNKKVCGFFERLHGHAGLFHRVV